MTKQQHAESPWYLRPWIPVGIIFGVACALYVNTISHSFTQDDAIVIYNNRYVKEGVGGLRKIFSEDSFAGFFGESGKSSLVSGGRYRPLTLAVFALLWEVVGDQPWVFHLLVIICYGLLVSLLFKVVEMFTQLYPSSRIMAFCTSLIFAVHPVHTEAVANVKGLDEVFSLLWSLLAILLSRNYMRNGSYWMLPLIVVTFGAALLSKENAIIFLLLGPVTLYLFQPHDEALRLSRVFGVLGMTAITYLIYRGSVIGWDIGSAPREMMNNPFIKIEGNRYVDISVNERISTILYALGRYIQLLFVPHPLSHDYYPRVWGDLTLLTPAVVASSIMQITLLLIAVLGIRRRSFISYCIIFFYLSIGLVANVLFPIGTYMSERFLFTPSLAVCLLGGYAFVNTRTRVGVSIRWGLFAGLLALFSIKTITRNTVWQDDFTLFTTDVHTSPGSAKVQNAAGGALVNRAYTMDEGPEKTELLNRAIHHLNQAIEIHPNYKNAHLLLGNANSYLRSYDQSISAYDNALLVDPYYDEASANLLIVLREAARYQGQTRKDYVKATTYLKRSLDLAPDDHETNVLMGVALGSQGKHREAVTYFEKAIQINPEAARGYVKLGYALLNLGDEEEAQIQFQQAISIDPTALDR